jgi:phosphinothricin acetyltransferase
MDSRAATEADLPPILAIYNDVIATTDAIYEDQAATLDARRAWFAERTLAGWPVLVAEADGAVAGFSSYGPWRPRWGYRHTVEHTVHVRADFRGKGIGSALVQALFPRAAAQGMHVMIGGVDSQAKASLRMHAKLGFEVVATFREVAKRHDGWLDLVMVQKFV